MAKTHTKEAAEAILRELPSVRGAFVREDVNGHPREVHVLVGPGPEPRHLARDIRDLLEERLGVPIDQRVISIAQLSERAGQLPLDELAASAGGRSPAARPAPEPAAAATAPVATPATAVGAPPPAAAPPSRRGSPRVLFDGLESATRNGRTEVRVRLLWNGGVFEGVGEEIEGGHGRVRAAASAALRAATAACGNRLTLELEAASVVSALGRDYALVSALALSPLIGRRPLPVAGAHPLDAGAETAAALAALQASNRLLDLALRD